MTFKIKDLVFIALFTAIVSILSIITIPTPSGVPMTLQTFAIPACGYILGTKKGTFSVILYIILGACGLPVFAGMTGGISHLLGLSGGFITGFIFLAFLSGYSNNFKNKFIVIILSLLGIFLCHFLGVLQYSLLSKNNLLVSFTSVSLPFIVKDIIFVAFAKIFAVQLEKILYLNKFKI